MRVYGARCVIGFARTPVEGEERVQIPSGTHNFKLNIKTKRTAVRFFLLM